jgi:peptidoglycan/xylan/chitin deacetylase (PgdA/CDA1 family)
MATTKKYWLETFLLVQLTLVSRQAGVKTCARGGGMSRVSGSPAVALTFDMEHPSRRDQSPESPGRLLDALAQHSASATFFIQGRWARSHPDLARRVASDGHLVGSHSHFHAPLPELTDHGIRADVDASTQALQDVVDVDPRPWFRCPFGAGHDDLRVLDALSHCGYRNVHWNVDTGDWEPGRTPTQVAAAVIDGVGTVDTAVVLMHTWPTATPAALPSMIQRLSAAGYSFVTLAELSDDELAAVSPAPHESKSRG